MSLTGNYWEDGKLVAEGKNGTARVYDAGGILHLETGPPGTHHLWTHSEELEWYREHLLPRLYRITHSRPGNRVLEFGLGLGLSAMLIADDPHVQELVTVEKNADVIDCFKQLNKVSRFHKIVNADAFEFIRSLPHNPANFASPNKFNFVFADIWTAIDRDTVRDITTMLDGLDSFLVKGAEFLPWVDDYIEDWFASSSPKEFQQKAKLL